MERAWFDISGRFELIDASPILSGLLVAALIPWFLFIPERPLWIRVFKLLILLGLVTVLALTGSRGPILATLLALLILDRLLYNVRQPVAQGFRRTISFVWLSACVALAAIYRVRQWSTPLGLFDKSVLHRLSIWRALPTLLWWNPLGGLGHGNAGYYYSQWFENLQLNYLYTTIYNNYCEMGIAYGLLVMAGYLSATIFAFLIGWECLLAITPRGQVSSIFLAAFGSFLLLSVGGIAISFCFSSTITYLWWLDWIVCVSYCLSFQELGSITRNVAIGWLFSLFLIALSAFWANAPRGPEEFTYLKRIHGIVIAGSKKPLNVEGPRATLLVDRSQMGLLFGHEIRRSMLGAFPGLELLVLDPRYALPSANDDFASVAILTGHTYTEYPRIVEGGAKHVVLINPTGRLTATHPSVETTVWLHDFEYNRDRQYYNGLGAIAYNAGNEGLDKVLYYLVLNE
jgi:hypothetical protein